MNKQVIIYWVTTILFAGFMMFSAVPDILLTEQAKQFITHLGYPVYFIPFIGVAKVLGCIAIVIPNFPRIREWAYAGLFFDLIGAVYSNGMTDGFQPGLLGMIPIFAIGITSYIYSTKRINSKT